MTEHAERSIAIIGGGPAGLMAAETLARSGHAVVVYEAKPSVARKFLRAGIGGLNITHDEAYAVFCTRYGAQQASLQAMLDRFPPAALRVWVEALGIATFAGSSGKVFPEGMKAAPLLRAWVQRLRALGVRFQLRHRWLGWDENEALLFDTPAGSIHVRPRATVLALGGGSWPQLGSDGAWVPWLREKAIAVAPLQSANCGFDAAWSEHLRERHAGANLKSVVLRFTDLRGHTSERRGELIISQYGVEGSLIYAYSRRLREAIEANGSATFTLDLAPDRTEEQVSMAVRHARGARSLASHLKGRLNISGVKMALLWETLGKDAGADPGRLARRIKALPITVTATRPLAEAISTAGGVRFSEVDERLMLKVLPGVFLAGEMLDWEAPTGGYLLTACLAQGVWAGEGVRAWLDLIPKA
ncbi:MAG: TIGR03862 family flavoprotein [Pigmentiphaga sp.]|nr:TIGR03862 family flavoprotein [Pigmentiphaga sp.]